MLTFIALAALAVATAVPPHRQPVAVGGSSELDACPSVAAVSIDGDVFLFDGPADYFPYTKRLSEGSLVYLCSETSNGEWAGVVILEAAYPGCGVASPVANRVAYDGPCASGWVRRSALKVVAG
ncbi:hypothetical protein GCM10027188_29160 [Lysobacter humi (ex Lee et al. 2017)]